MSLDIGFYEIIVLLLSLCLNIVLFIVGHLDTYHEYKSSTGMTRSFSSRQITTSIIFDIAVFIYFIMRIYQWSSGYYVYMFMDITVIILSAVINTSSYPFITNKLKDIEIVYKDKLKNFKK